MKLLLTILFLSITGLCLCQDTIYKISGYIIDDKNNAPVQGAHIKISGKDIGTISNQRGYYSLEYKTAPLNIEITHINYNDRVISINEAETKKTDILLSEKVYMLSDALVQISRPVNIVAGKLYDVADYEFIDSNIVMLAYCYKEKYNPWIIVMDANGDTIQTRQISASGNLYKDCHENIYIVNKDSAYIITDSLKEIKPGKVFGIDSFRQNILACISYLNNTTYLQQYYYNNQVLSYYYNNQGDTSYKELRVIADFAGLRMLIDRDRFNSMGAKPPSEADLRFEEMCFFDPIFAPLVKVKDQLCIFNYVDSVIEIYNKYSKLIREVPLKFHSDRNWKEEIYIDNISGRVYTLFKKDGISTIKEINLADGKLIRSIKIPYFLYIEKIKVNNNHIYFLYRTNESNDLMKLYKLEI
jgi:hypothetical protein